MPLEVRAARTFLGATQHKEDARMGDVTAGTEAPGESETTGGLTRRQMIKVGGATFAGYAVAVDKALAQAIKTDTTGIQAGDAEVKIARPEPDAL
jgi:hypothetical protein